MGMAINDEVGHVQTRLHQTPFIDVIGRDNPCSKLCVQRSAKDCMKRMMITIGNEVVRQARGGNVNVSRFLSEVHGNAWELFRSNCYSQRGQLGTINRHELKKATKDLRENAVLNIVDKQQCDIEVRCPAFRNDRSKAMYLTGNNYRVATTTTNISKRIFQDFWEGHLRK